MNSKDQYWGLYPFDWGVILTNQIVTDFSRQLEFIVMLN